MPITDAIPTADRRSIADLAQRYAELAALPVQAERRELWRAHNDLEPVRPLVRLVPEGSWREILPQSALTCTSEAARGIEWLLRHRIIEQERFGDDSVLDPVFWVWTATRTTGWGVEQAKIASPQAHGAFTWEPVIHGPADLKKLRHPELVVDGDEDRRRLERAQDLLGAHLPVQVRKVSLHYHLMAEWTRLRGLEEVFTDMLDAPEFTHEAIDFLAEGHRRLQGQYEELGLLASNHDSGMINQGAFGATRELPKPGYDPGRVRLCDSWGWAEAQELAVVGPDQHEEFALRYERELLQPFGLTCYGCCEDLTRKLDHVLKIPHLRRISISPWSDLWACAEKLKGDYVMCWKPNPARLVGVFDEQAIRRELRTGIEAAVAHGSRLEMILKDTHTCEDHPERFERWSAIAREEIDRAWSARV